MFQEISSVLKVKSRIKRIWRTYIWQSRWNSSAVGELNVAVFMASVRNYHILSQRSKSLLVFLVTQVYFHLLSWKWTRKSFHFFPRIEIKGKFACANSTEDQPISTQSSSAPVEERDQELWGTPKQDCLWLVSAKNNKSVSDCTVQACTKAVGRAACLACERVFR